MGKFADAIEKSKKGSPIETQPQEQWVISPEPAKIEEVFSESPRISVANHKMHQNLVSALNPQSFASEQFKQLRTSLLFPESGASPRTIMITSAFPEEGKSFVAANLALSIAYNINEHVLLMDCDLRRPSLHTLFGFDAVIGLTDYLTNGTPLDRVLLKSPVDKLTLLPTGTKVRNPSELLSSEKMSNLIKEVKSRYSDRYIIIDLPPPNFTAEAKALARQVDGILLVIQYGKTNREIINDLIKTVGKEKILGVVFNRYDGPMEGYAKYKKYDKYYVRNRHRK